MKIRTKIILSLVLVSIPFFANGIYFIYRINSLSSDFSIEIPKDLGSLVEKTELNAFADSIKYYDEVLTQSARNYAFTGDKKWEKIYLDAEPELDQTIASAKKLGGRETEAFFASINKANQSLVSMEHSALDNVDKGERQTAIDTLESAEYWGAKEIYRNALDGYIKLQEKEYGDIKALSGGVVEGIASYMETLAKETRLLALITILILFILVILYYIFISRIITKPLGILQKAAERVMKEDFDFNITSESKDEITLLSQSFDTLTKIIKQSRIEIEKKVEEQTKELAKKTKDLDEQKNAVLNVLEDAEKERNIAETLAEDLKKFKLAVENASDHVVITDPEGVILFANDSVKKITGFSREEIIGKKAGAKETWGGIMAPEFYKTLWETIKEKKIPFVGNIQNRRKNGEKYEVFSSISPVLDSDGNVDFFVGIERDITREKEVDRAKTEFVSLASHQLRTPLSSINWYTEMILGGDAGEITADQKRYLNEIYASSKRMGELVGALLNVSRLELGTFAIEPSTIDVPSLAKSVMEEMKPGINEKKIITRETYGDGINAFYADEKLLRIAIQNLASNAIKYTNPEGNVEMRVEKLPKGTDLGGKKLKDEDLVISVSDSGIGIPEAQQHKIFGKLFRADNAAISRTEGTGLGLYIVKSIVEKSGGDIWFQSVENKGTTFFVAFPITGMKKKEGAKKLS